MATQNRVIALFRDELGYRHLGDWSDREGNSNVEEGLLRDWLIRQGCSAPQIAVVLHRLRTEADHHGRTLYEACSPASRPSRPRCTTACRM